MAQKKHILVIRLSALGDVAMTLPVLRVLLANYPDLKITVLSKGFHQPLFKGLERCEFLEADVYGAHKGWGLLTLAKQAKQLQIDAVADLHNVLRSKVIRSYLSLQGIPVKTLDKGRSDKKRLIDQGPEKVGPLTSMHERYAEVFGQLGLPIDLTAHQFPKPLDLSARLHSFIGKHTKKIVGIAPFAAYPSKMYPLELMEEVVAGLSRQQNCGIFLFGATGQEQQQLTTWEQTYEGVVNVAGQLTFEDELALISNLDLMVAMDSGNGHLAANYNVPVVTLWGVTHPYLGFQPFGQPDSQQLLSDAGQFPQIPTSVYGNKYPEDYKGVMRTIPPQRVLEKINKLL